MANNMVPTRPYVASVPNQTVVICGVGICAPDQSQSIFGSLAYRWARNFVAATIAAAAADIVIPVQTVQYLQASDGDAQATAAGVFGAGAGTAASFTLNLSDVASRTTTRGAMVERRCIFVITGVGISLGLPFLVDGGNGNRFKYPNWFGAQPDGANYPQKLWEHIKRNSIFVLKSNNGCEQVVGQAQFQPGPEGYAVPQAWQASQAAFVAGGPEEVDALKGELRVLRAAAIENDPTSPTTNIPSGGQVSDAFVGALLYLPGFMICCPQTAFCGTGGMDPVSQQAAAAAGLMPV